MLTTAASVRFTVWTNAMLTGACDPDTAAQRSSVTTSVTSVAGSPRHPEPATLPVALNLLRAAGATQAHLALPIPGDPIGLAGPPTFNEAALETGEAVVLTGPELGLVPAYVGPAVQWTVLPAAVPLPADLGEADRGLRVALIEAAESLAALDVARWKPEVADALIDIRRIGQARATTWPPATSPRGEDRGDGPALSRDRRRCSRRRRCGGHRGRGRRSPARAARAGRGRPAGVGRRLRTAGSCLTIWTGH